MSQGKLKYFDRWPRRRYISPTMASCVLQCPWQYWAKYLGKVDKVDGLALRRGAFFDSLCAGEDITVGLSGADVDTITKRYLAYKPLIPPGTPQVPVQFELGYNDWWVRGYVDWVPDDDALPFTEQKLATRPWERKKIAYNRMQIMTYNKGLLWRPGQFDVNNMEAEGTQRFSEKDYLPRGNTPKQAWDKVEKDYIKAAKLIEGNIWEPCPGILCKGENKHGDTWECDYWAVCPITLEQQAKEMRINEFTKCF